MFNCHRGMQRGIKEPASRELIEKLKQKAEENERNEAKNNMETYYVVEVNGRYYENDAKVYGGTELYEHIVDTTDSLLECKRFYSKPDAQRIADRFNFTVRKVKVECE